MARGLIPEHRAARITFLAFPRQHAGNIKNRRMNGWLRLEDSNLEMASLKSDALAYSKRERQNFLLLRINRYDAQSSGGASLANRSVIQFTAAIVLAWAARP
jgi:hypothetical protein